MALFTGHENPYFLHFDNNVNCTTCHCFNRENFGNNLHFKQCECFGQEIHFGIDSKKTPEPFKYASNYKPQLAGRSRFDHYCKNHVWRHILPILEKCETLPMTMKKYFSNVTYEGHPVEATLEGVAHALFRTFLHFHKDTMNNILDHYVQHYNKKHIDTLSVLKEAIDYEYKNNLSFFDEWEKQLVGILAMDNEFQKKMDIALKTLKMDVVLVAWLSEWKK